MNPEQIPPSESLPWTRGGCFAPALFVVGIALCVAALVLVEGC